MSYSVFAHTSFDNMLGTLDHLAGKALEAGLTDEILAARLTEDMFPLELQFRVAINQVLLALQQVGGEAVPLEETPYRSFDDVRARIAVVRQLVAKTDPRDWADAAKQVDLTLPNGVRFVMSAQDDIRDWILPNFYFHVSMVYALLRQQGVQIGKMDFIPHMARHVVSADV